MSNAQATLHMRHSPANMSDQRLDIQHSSELQLVPLSKSTTRTMEPRRESALLAEIQLLTKRVQQLQQENDSQAKELMELMNNDDLNTGLAQEEIRRLYRSSAAKDKEIVGLQLIVEQLRSTAQNSLKGPGKEARQIAAVLSGQGESIQGEQDDDWRWIQELKPTILALQERISSAETLCTQYQHADKVCKEALRSLESEYEKAKVSFARRIEELTEALATAELYARSQEDTIVELTKQLCLHKTAALAPDRDRTSSEATRESRFAATDHPSSPSDRLDSLIVTDEETIDRMPGRELDVQYVLLEKVWDHKLWTRSLQPPPNLSKMAKKEKAKLIKSIAKRHLELKKSCAITTPGLGENCS
ncbi:hypothetical protein EV715DRAFT_297651 [Schizophyllum commune]